LVTADPSIAVAVLVADCVPVLLADGTVVGVVHAGRAGVAAGVVAEAVTAMVRLGAVAERMRAVVGPAICGSCYELPVELRTEVTVAVEGVESVTSWGTPAVDLPAAVRIQLAGCGIVRVSSVDSCTMEDPRWYSHRGSRADPGRPAGRFAAVVRALPPQ
jgi:YfiH family protein